MQLSSREAELNVEVARLCAWIGYIRDNSDGEILAMTEAAIAGRSRAAHHDPQVVSKWGWIGLWPQGWRWSEPPVKVSLTAVILWIVGVAVILWIFGLAAAMGGIWDPR